MPRSNRQQFLSRCLRREQANRLLFLSFWRSAWMLQERQCHQNWTTFHYCVAKSCDVSNRQVHSHQQEAVVLVGTNCTGPFSCGSRLFCSSTFNKHFFRAASLHSKPSGGFWDLSGTTLRHRVLGHSCRGLVLAQRMPLYLLLQPNLVRFCGFVSL